tara:strand:+ start:1018 stop:1251 length:234 start_codon:yes stop_codon:yes gene_type:complete
MSVYVATIVSRKKGSKRNKRRKVEIFAESITDAERMVEPELKRGETIYDIGRKMSNSMAFDRALNSTASNRQRGRDL